MRGEASAATLNNHSELTDLWDWSLPDTEMKARIRGVQAMMTSFDFFFGCSLGERLLKQIDNLNSPLQSASMSAAGSAAQGSILAHDVTKTLLKGRNDSSFELFWELILKRKENFKHVSDPKLPKRRKVPQRFEVGESNTHYYPSTPKEHCRQIYFDVMESATQRILSRFDQEDFKIYKSIQELFLKSIHLDSYEDDLKVMVKMYKDDVNASNLEKELLLLPQIVESMGFDNSQFDVHDLVTFFQSLDRSRQLLLPEVTKLGKILLVLLATNAVNDPSQDCNE